MNPFISIIVPVYNAEKTLERCVRSILHQDYSNYEVILVDDGSLDKSGLLCDAYVSIDPKLRVIHQRNSGVSAARNSGIRAAQGTYLLFLDSDDALAPGALTVYADNTDNSRCDVVIGKLSVIEAEQVVRYIGTAEDEITGCNIWNQVCTDSAPFGYAGGKLVRAAIVKQNNIVFDTAMQSQEDLDFFLSVYKYCATFRLISRCVYLYYYAPTKRTPPTWDFIANQLKLLRIAQEKTSLTPQALASVRQRILTLLYTGLYTASEQGTFTETAQRIAQVEGLHSFLASVPAEGEHRFVANAFAAKQYRRIYFYFTVRNRIRDLYRKIRS